MNRVVVAAVASAALALAGCSVSNPTVSSAPIVLVDTSTPLPSSPPPLPPSKSIGGIDAAITAQGAPLLSPGGDPMSFAVMLTNTTTADIPDVELVVSFGHCSCGLPGASIMPKGTMRMLDPVTNVWGTAPYVVEGTGTDYLDQDLVPPFVLKAGQRITYQLEASLNPDPEVTAGTTLLGVTLMTPTDRGHAAYLRVDVEP